MRGGRTWATVALLVVAAAVTTVTGVLSGRNLTRLQLIDARLRETRAYSSARIRLQRQAFALMPSYLPGDNVLVVDIRIQLAQAAQLGDRLPEDVLRSIDRLEAVLDVSLVSREDLLTAAFLLEGVTAGEAEAQERLLADAITNVDRERNTVFAVLLFATLLLVALVWIAPQRMAAPLRPLVRFWLRGVLDQRRTSLKFERIALAGEAAASLAHELRNPLAGVSLGLQNLERDAEDLAPRIQPLVGEIERVTRILNDHLGAMNGPVEESREVDVHRMLTDLTELLGFEAPSGVTLEVRAPIGVTCRTREDRLRQVLLNLGLNALHALEKGGGKLRFEGERTAGQLTLRVRDSGPGFPAGVLRGDSVPFTSQRPGGSGLGLRVVRRAVEELGGDIELSNPPEGGALAEVVIPCTGTS